MSDLPSLRNFSRCSCGTSVHSCVLCQYEHVLQIFVRLISHLIEVDDGLPESVLVLVEVSHANLSEVTWMVLVHVGAVMMLSTCQTATTRMLPVLANSSVSSRHMAAAVQVC